MSTRPYIINQAFVMSGDGTVSSQGDSLVLVDYSTYDGMVEDISVQLFTSQRAIDMIKQVVSEMYEESDDAPESASGECIFEDGHRIAFDDTHTFAEIHYRLETACDYAIITSPFQQISIYGDLARKTWYSIETRILTP